MPTSREVLAASNNAADQGFTKEAKLLYDEYKRLERLEYGITDPVEDPGFFENVTSGLGAGAVGMGELVSLGGAALLEEETELEARKKIKSIGDSLRPKGGDPESLTYQVSSGVGGILAALPVTAAAALGVKSSPVLAPLTAAASLGVAAMAGEQSEMARESGATEEERNIAIRKAAPFGVVEALSPARMLKGVGLKNFGDALDNLTGKIDDGLINGIVGRLQSAGVTGVVEGVQETASAIYQNLVARGYDPERELIDAGVIEEGRTGAGAGFVVQALADAIGRRSKRYDDLDAVTPEEVLASAGYTDGVWDGEKMVYGEEAAKLVEQDTKKKGSTPDLFPKELNEAQKAEAEKQGPIDPRKPEEPTEEKTEKPKPFTVKPATDTSRTPDMIERAEEQQTREDTGMLPSDPNLSTLESQIKEKPDVGKQVDGTPVTEASGASVQSGSKSVVRGQPADTEGVGKPKQGGLDSGVDSAGKPAGRKRRRVTSLKAQDKIADKLYTAAQGDLKDKNKLYTPEYRKDYISGYKEGYDNKHGLSYTPQDNVDKRPKTEQGNIYSEGYYLGSSQARADFKGGLKSEPSTAKPKPIAITKNKALQTREATGAVPSVTTDGKLEYSEAKNFIPSHAQFKQDATKLNTLSKVQVDTSSKADKKDFTELNETATYFQKFSNSTSALYNLAYDNSNPGKNTTYVGKDAEALKGTGGKQAKSALSWVKKNLSPATLKAVTAQINKFNTTDRTNKVEAGKQELKKKVAANTKAKLKAKESTVAKTEDTRGKGTQYHGTSRPVTTLKDDSYASLNIYGQGFYTTDATDVAKGYSQKGRGKEPTIYKVSKKGDVNFFDLEQPLNNQIMGWLEESTDFSREAMGDMPENPTVRDALDDIRDFGTSEGLSADSIQEQLDSFKFVLMEKGFEGYRHIGGQFTDKKPHNVEIFWEPSKHITVEKTEAKTEANISKGKTDTKPLSLKAQKQKASEVYTDYQTIGERGKPKTEKQKAIAQKYYEEDLRKDFIAGYKDGYAYKHGRSSDMFDHADKHTPKKGSDVYQAQALYAQGYYWGTMEARDSGMFPPAKTEQAKPKAVDTKKESTQEEIDFTAKFLGVDMRVYDALDNPITKEQVKLLQDGKLPEVLEQLSKSLTDSDLAKFATALSKVVTTTKVEFVAESAIVKIAGKPKGKRTYVGKFDPETNTILLNKDVPLNAHVILHESSHAFIDNFMRANPNASPVRAINRVYKDMMEKKMIFGAYGAENVYEFVAESMGNKKFRAHIDKMRLDDTGAVSNISLFKRLIHAIRNLFRMLMGKDPIRKEPTALDQIDNWILQVLSPDHEGMAVYPVISNKNMSEAIESIYRPNDVKAPKRKVDFSDLWEDGKYKAGIPALKALTKVVDSQMLADLAKFTDLGDSGIKLHRAIEEQRGNMIAAADKMDVELKKYKDWVKSSNEKMVRALNDLVYDVNYGATIYQVDPTLPLSTYLDDDGTPKIVEGNNLYEIRQKQEQELKLLLPKDSERKSVLAEFTRHRNIYRDLFAKLKRSLNLVLDTLENAENKDAVASVRKSIDSRIFDKPGLFVYLPLVRGGGAYGLSMTGRIDNGDGTFREEPVFLTFTKRIDRKAFINLIPEMPEVVNNSYTEYNNTDSNSFYEDAPRKGFVEDLLNLLEGAKVKDDVVKDVLQMYVDVLPETSFSKSFTKRLGRIGYIQDIGVALEQKGRSLSSQVAKIEGSRKVRDARDALVEKKNATDSEFAKVIANTFIKDHAGFALNGATNKPLEKVIKAVNQYSFMMTLGVNVSGAMVQLAQIPVQYGWLGARFGYDEAFSAMMRAQKVNLGAGLSPTQYYNLDTFAVKESTKKLIKKVSLGDEKKAQERIKRLEDLAPLIELAYKRARMYSFKTMTDVGVTESQGYMTKATHISGLMFNAAERVNTNTALIASYDLVREKMAKQRKAGKKYYSVELSREIDVPKDVNELRKIAAQEALYLTSEINAGATLETTMPVAKEHMGRALLMYKHYGARMYATMIKYLYRSMPLTGLSKAEKKVARRQVMGTIFVGLAYGGLMGFPLLGGLVGMIFDALTPDDEDNFDETVRKAVPEYIAKGPVSYLSDVDIQARIKLTDMLFQENRFLYDASLEEQVGYYLGGPSISSFKKQLRGYEDLTEKNYDRAFENFAPVGISNMLQAVRYAEEGGARTRRGQFIVEDMPTSDLVAKAIGFRPYSLSRQQDINARNLRVQRTITEERGDLMSKWNIATGNRDYERMEEVLDDIKDFSKKNPSYPITNKDLIKSSKSFQTRTDTMQHGVAINPKLKGIIEESNREFERED